MKITCISIFDIHNLVQTKIQMPHHQSTVFLLCEYSRFSILHLHNLDCGKKKIHGINLIDNAIVHRIYSLCALYKCMLGCHRQSLNSIWCEFFTIYMHAMHAIDIYVDWSSI